MGIRTGFWKTRGGAEKAALRLHGPSGRKFWHPIMRGSGWGLKSKGDSTFLGLRRKK